MPVCLFVLKIFRHSLEILSLLSETDWGEGFAFFSP
jgi:hypothetical protein